jgi:hypothetical protein
VVGADLQSRQLLMVVASGAALVALIVLTALSVYKPAGMTPYGWRMQDEQHCERLEMPGKGYNRSTMVAMPCPTPMHMVARP